MSYKNLITNFDRVTITFHIPLINLPRELSCEVRLPGPVNSLSSGTSRKFRMDRLCKEIPGIVAYQSVSLWISREVSQCANLLGFLCCPT